MTTIYIVCATALLWAFLAGLGVGMWLVRRSVRRASDDQYRVVQEFVERPPSNGRTPQRR